MPNFVVSIEPVDGLKPLGHLQAQWWPSLGPIYRVLSISCGPFYSNKSRKTPIVRPSGRGMGVFHVFEMWPKFFLRRCCAGRTIVLCFTWYIDILRVYSTWRGFAFERSNLQNPTLVLKMQSYHDTNLCHIWWQNWHHNNSWFSGYQPVKF